MKRKLYHTLVTLLLTAVLLLALPQSALAASASLSGNSTVQPGSSVTLTLSVSGSSIYGLSGTLSCGSGLTFTNYSCSVSGWSMEVNGNNFSAYGTSASSGGAVLTVTLKVASDAKADSALSASFGNINVSDGENDLSLGTASWNGKVGAPPSNNCDLKGITVTNATLSPAFNKNTTYYTCTVPYDVQKLNLDYFRADQGQTVNISGNGDFVVGENTVTLTVKASNGATKTYTIVVTRQQDPNYKASTDATLSALSMEGVTLSPAFNPNVTEYIGYVSHETMLVKLTGVPHDEKAMKVTESEVGMTKDGVTDVSVVCTAEDGKTTQTYTVHVYRMPAYTGGIPLIEYTNEKDIVPEEEPIPAFSIPKTMTLPLLGEASTALVGAVIGAVILILLFLLGFLIGRVRRRSNQWEEEPFEEETSPLSPVIPQKAQPKPTLEPVKPKAASPDLKPERQVVPPKAAEPKKNEKPSLDTVSLNQLLKDIHDM